MGSRFAIDRLVQACQQHPKRDHIWFSKQPCSSKFAFANGEQSTVKERLVIHFRNDRAQSGWITTCIDILDKGKVPILFSVEQMRNLRMNIEHTPAGELMTCPLFGMQRTALAVSTSNHPVLDIMALATSSWNRCTFSPKTSHAQHAMVNIVHTQTKVVRDSRDQNKNQHKCRKFVTSLTRSRNHVTLVPRPKSHLRELRFQEFEVKFFVLLSSIMEKFLSILSQNFQSCLCMRCNFLEYRFCSSE